MHRVFKELREEREFYLKSQGRFKKILKGNYSIPDPKTLNDALKVDLIGMRPGQEVF